METMKTLLSRRSISKLAEPYPSKEEMENVYQAALRAPDHSWLRPWRFIEVVGDGRKKLGKAFIESTKKTEELDEERESKIAALPMRSPMIIVVIAKINHEKPNVPRLEQIQSTAAAAQNIQAASTNPHHSANNSTRDRLRRKLEKRRQEKEANN